MDRQNKIKKLRATLAAGGRSVGTWMQIPHPSIAEILGNSGFDWVSVDMEHGSISHHQLPDLFRAIELGDTLPLVRLADHDPKCCKQALDAGAAGVIVPMIESARQLRQIIKASCWPPSGNRGVGFSRANLFGDKFDQYAIEAQGPLCVAMIEHVRGVENIREICAVRGLDAVLIGPYDLSASLGLTGQFAHPIFREAISTIIEKSKSMEIATGVHIIDPKKDELEDCFAQGHRFVAYSIDAVMLRETSNMRNFNFDR